MYPTDEMDAGMVSENGRFLISSWYGGMIAGLEDGKETSIFIGAASE